MLIRSIIAPLLSSKKPFPITAFQNKKERTLLYIQTIIGINYTDNDIYVTNYISS